MRAAETPGSLVIFLLADMLNTIIREIIIIANAYGSPKTSSIAAVVLFGVVPISCFIILAIIHFVYLCVRKDKYRCTTFIVSSVQTLGALLYFYGDNITILLNTYKVELKCTDTCLANNRVAAAFSLGVALMIFQEVPTILHKLFDLNKRENHSKKTKTPNWFSALNMITVMIKADILYSAVVVLVESREFCNRTDIATNISFICACVIFGVLTIIIYCVTLNIQTTKKDSNKVFMCLTIVGTLAVFICIPLYILADNSQPLDCAFGCDSFAANTTINDLNCNQIMNSRVRLGLTIPAFILVAIDLVSHLLYMPCNYKSKKKA